MSNPKDVFFASSNKPQQQDTLLKVKARDVQAYRLSSGCSMEEAKRAVWKRTTTSNITRCQDLDTMKVLLKSIVSEL